MKPLLQALLLALLLTGCQSPETLQGQGFTLKGKTQNLADSSIIQLFDIEANAVFDSTYVQNNEFEFKGQLENTPVQMVIQTNDISQYKFLWLENKAMEFDASEVNFEKAKLKGSEIQEWVEEKLFSKTDTMTVNNMEDLNRQREIEMQFVEAYPNNVISVNILAIYSTVFEKARIEKVYQKLTKEFKESKHGKHVKKFLELNQNPQLGEKYVDFAMENSQGTKVRLSENMGKVTLLEFWASNCAPCRTENPNLVETYDQYKEKGFEIFAVSLDLKKDNWEKAIAKDQLSWMQVCDLSGYSNAAALIYGIQGIPDNFLIDQDGKIIGRNLRGEDLNKELKKLL